MERQERTGADRRWVHTYVEGDRLRFSGKTASLGIKAGDYATVTHVDGDNDRLTDGGSRFLTTSIYADRTGRRYGDKIEPDEVGSGPDSASDRGATGAAAERWLKTALGCPVSGQ